MVYLGKYCTSPAKSLMGYCPAIPTPTPPLLYVIKDFSHTTKRAEGEECVRYVPTSWINHDEAAGRQRAENTGQIRKYVNSINITEGLAGGGVRVCARVCVCRFSARGRRWQRKNWGMPAPVIVLPSLVISKIRRGRREGGSVVKTRQRCTPPHAHAAILQAALASLKMAARAHATSGPAPAGCPLPGSWHLGPGSMSSHAAALKTKGDKQTPSQA